MSAPKEGRPMERVCSGPSFPYPLDVCRVGEIAGDKVIDDVDDFF